MRAIPERLRGVFTTFALLVPSADMFGWFSKVTDYSVRFALCIFVMLKQFCTEENRTG